MKNNNQFKRTLITGIAVALIGVIGWIFVQVRDLPANYIPRGEIEKRLERIENKLDQILFQERKINDPQNNIRPR